MIIVKIFPLAASQPFIDVYRHTHIIYIYIYIYISLSLCVVELDILFLFLSFAQRPILTCLRYNLNIGQKPFQFNFAPIGPYSDNKSKIENLHLKW